MKRVFAFVTIIITGLTLVGCTTTTDNPITTTKETLSTEQAIASLSFLSAGFLNASSTDTTTANNALFLTEHDTTELETELDDVNVYVDKLLAFIEGGADQFGSVVNEESDRTEYAYKITINVNDEVYVLYYNVDVDTNEISGLFIIDTVEYVITAQNGLEDADDFDDGDIDDDDDDADIDDDDDDDDVDVDDEEEEEEADEEEEEENESEMVLVATNGTDSITITYETEYEEDEVETAFVIEKNIGGVESEVSIEIKEEADEYKIEIEDGDNYYELKREAEEEGLVYKLEYEVNGVEGEVKITVTQDENGDNVYRYEIEEEGKEAKEIEKDDPDDDDDEEDEEEEDTETTSA